MGRDTAPTPALGWVKFFDEKRGHGLLLDVGSGRDVFVHYTKLRLRDRGWRTLRRGEYVQFRVVETARGPAAEDVTGVGGGPLMCEAAAHEVAAPTFHG